MVTDRTNSQWAEWIVSQTSSISSSAEGIDQSLSNITSPDATFAATIDHTLLKTDATPGAIDELCAQAIKFKFKSCCVNGMYVKRVAERLEGSSVIPCAVVGFPLGAMKTEAKAYETREAISDGAQEIDMVINVGALKAGLYDEVFNDIYSVVQAAGGRPVKVILETFLLDEKQKIAACFIAVEAGVAFVKTCTGFGGGGATVEDVSLMKRVVSYKNGSVKVKASAGIRTFEKCVEMYKAGADRIGTSSAAVIIEGGGQASGTY
jgi:deoxyribose-phosphate aldolase